MNARTHLIATARTLCNSEKGRNALRAILAMLDGGGIALDRVNQDAVMSLLSAAWGALPGSARDIMRDALAGYFEDGGAQ